MLNSTKIEDVVEVAIELGKNFVREKFVFSGDSFFFCSTKGADGLVLKLMIQLSLVGGKVGVFNWFLDFFCGGGCVGGCYVDDDINAISAFN